MPLPSGAGWARRWTHDQVPDYLSGPLPETLPYADGIAAAKQALRDSFPDALRAN